MKSVYVRENLKITEFDKDDVIATSGMDPTPSQPDPEQQVTKREKENRYATFSTFDSGGRGTWF